MRAWRKAHPLNAEQRRKANARAHARMALKRGQIERQPCEVCGAHAEMHHDDYDRHLDVRWLCRVHHLAHHVTQS